jgi:hypothetical protein
MRGNDYVYTLPVTTARVNRNNAVNNGAARMAPRGNGQTSCWDSLRRACLSSHADTPI